jgi:hypothetical protein
MAADQMQATCLLKRNAHARASRAWSEQGINVYPLIMGLAKIKTRHGSAEEQRSQIVSG